MSRFFASSFKALTKSTLCLETSFATLSVEAATCRVCWFPSNCIIGRKAIEHPGSLITSSFCGLLPASVMKKAHFVRSPSSLSGMTPLTKPFTQVPFNIGQKAFQVFSVISLWSL